MRTSSPVHEGVFSASKWLKIQVFLEPAEMEMLFSELSPVSLFNVSQISKNPEISVEQFLEAYKTYWKSLKEGSGPCVHLPTFSSVITKEVAVLYALEVRPGEFIAKLIRPAIQLQYHQFLPSEVDGGFHPMVHGMESISWGLQFSYPQLFQDPHSKEYLKVDDSALFPNTALYAQLSRWIRAHTVPVTFVWKGVKKATPLRMGKGCFSWINNHPQLKRKGIEVYTYAT